MFKLVGVQKIDTKEKGSFAKLHFIDDSADNMVCGCATFSEFVKWTDAYNDLVDCEVVISYGKGYNGCAYLRSIEPA